jgi:hypothetical protein
MLQELMGWPVISQAAADGWTLAEIEEGYRALAGGYSHQLS